MERLLIRGGEQYLPFARSRVKALRALMAATETGTAAQKYVVGGVTILIQIVGDQERITITGGSVVDMDSGVVSAPFSAGLGQTYLPGTLQDTQYTAAYNAAFTVPSNGRLLNPGKISNGQFSGRVTVGSVAKGSILPNDSQAASFSPAKDNPTDDNLLVKKVTAAATPASVFTGKTRLWVQALYGLPLYKSGNAQLPISSAGPLGAKVAAYPVPGRTLDPVTITTSSGVWLDPVTYKHWLFNITDTAVIAYPLKCDAAHVGLRQLLKPSDKLNAESREHIEAYLLSGSLPDVTAAQTIPKSSIGSEYSMGYGWHWAWTAARADIVTMTTYWAGGLADNIGQESRHYALTMTANHGADGSTTFDCSVQLIEGPSRWVIKRNVWVLVEPDFGGGVMTKTTSAGGETAGGAGPFYAFYTRDELNVCRVEVTGHAGVNERNTLDQWFKPWDNVWQTLATNPADATDLTASALYFSLKLSIGSRVYEDFHFNDNKSGPGWKVDVTDNYGPPAVGTTSFGTGSSTYQLQFGTDTNHDPFNSHWDVTPVFYGPAYGPPGAIAKNVGSVHLCYATREFNTTTISNNSLVVVMVPAYDAEAVFVNARKWNSTTRSNRCVQGTGQYAFFENQTVFFNDGSYYQTTRELWFGHDGTFGNTPNTGNTTVESGDTRTNDLICSAGTVPAIFVPTDAFYILNQDDIEGLYKSMASVKGAVIAPGLISAAGYGLNEPPPLSPVMVGWA